MTLHPARPRHTLPLAGAEYDLLGTLEVVEAVEYALKDGVVQVTGRVVGMGLTDTARLLAAVLSANGHKLTARQAGQTLLDLGVGSEAFARVQLHLYAFLRVLLEPPELREAKATEMGELIGRMAAPPASRGRRTRKSA